MAKIIMVYTSMSGNTEQMAEAIAAGIRAAGQEIDVFDMMSGPEVYALNDYDGIILGAYTWGDGELPDEFLDFYEDLDSVKLTGKKAAVFGSCDSAYYHYGAAVDILIEKLLTRDATVELPGLKIELSPNPAEEETCWKFGKQFVSSLNK